MAGQLNTSFLDNDFRVEERVQPDSETAAVFATLAAHRSQQLAARVVQRGERDTSNWKWFGRWERMHR